MPTQTRRKFLTLSTGSALAAATTGFGTILQGFGLPAFAQTEDSAKAAAIEEWMNQWMSERTLVGALHLSRFVEPIYFLTKPISWKPQPDQAGQYKAITVPKGFVTDLTSVPRAFWSLLRPDGTYTYPAIIHDYLYWTQTRTKQVADQIMKFGMQDLGIDKATIMTIYEAVNLGGTTAWNNNAELKKRGEKRILKRFPEDPTTRWEHWKKQPDVFA